MSYGIERIYTIIDVADMTFEDIEKLMEDEGAIYAADCGLEFKDNANLKISRN